MKPWTRPRKKGRKVHGRRAVATHWQRKKDMQQGLHRQQQRSN